MSVDLTNASPSITGLWEGEAEAHNSRLIIRLHLYLEAGVLSGAIDFPSWGTLGWPLSHVHYEHPNIHFEIAGDRHTDTFDGELTQGAIWGTLRLWRNEAEVRLRQSQRVISIPYHREEIHFQNGDVTLAGTLLIPDRQSSHPAMIFTHGSGAETHDRNKFLADHFARLGIATLIYDKRGTGSSMGDWQQADFEQLASDTIAGIQLLKNRPEIDTAKIGLLGHSQGGWIASLAALHLQDAAFVVTVSTPAVTPSQQMLYAMKMRLRRNGFSGDEIKQAMNLKKRIDTYARNGEGRKAVERALEKAQAYPWFSASGYLAENLPEYQDYRWWRSILDFDPVPILERLHIPVLAIFGDQDEITDTEESTATLRKKVVGVTIQVFPRANHGMMVFPTPSEPFRWFGLADGYIETLTAWILERVGPPANT
jgi:pimeloyl-ACP methyl ester carboxylesterase